MSEISWMITHILKKLYAMHWSTVVMWQTHPEFTETLKFQYYYAIIVEYVQWNKKLKLTMLTIFTFPTQGYFRTFYLISYDKTMT